MKKWLWVITAFVFCSCRETNPNPNRSEDPDYPRHFYIKMPEFMAPWPKGTDVAEYKWHWESIDETIVVTSAGGAIPRKTLNPSIALNEEAKKQWIWLLSMEPNFKKAGENRYQSIVKGKNQWEVIIANVTDEHWFGIEVFVIISRVKNPSDPAPPLPIPKAKAILGSLESGSYVNRDTYVKLMGERPFDRKLLKVELNIEGELIYEGELISLSKLTELSRDIIAKNPKAKFHIKADKRVKTQGIKDAVAAAAAAGLEDVIFSAYAVD